MKHILESEELKELLDKENKTGYTKLRELVHLVAQDLKVSDKLIPEGIKKALKLISQDKSGLLKKDDNIVIKDSLHLTNELANFFDSKREKK